MSSLGFLRALVELAVSESVDDLLTRTVFLLEAELALKGYVEFWDLNGKKFVRGDPLLSGAKQRTWIGHRFTVGLIDT